MKKLFLLFCLILTASTFALADTSPITHFKIAENPYEQNQVSVVVTDTLNNTLDNVNGDYVFTINGFEDTLKFTSGVAFYKHKIDKSTFLYARHVDENGGATLSSLYYVYKSESKLVPIHISWMWLLIIPLSLVLIAYLFKRFIIIAIVIFCIFVYFNYHNNLSIPIFFQSIFDGLKHIF
ncbi:hypothetical protein [Mucilaginibacter sp.]